MDEPTLKTDPEPADIPAPIERLLAVIRHQMERLDALRDALAGLQGQIVRLEAVAQQHQAQVARITVVLGELQTQIDGLKAVDRPAAPAEFN